MVRILKEEKYANGSLKSRETLLDDRPEQQVSLVEAFRATAYWSTTI
jgi:hypothetical protein